MKTDGIKQALKRQPWVYQPLKACARYAQGLTYRLFRRFPCLEYKYALWANATYFGNYLMAGQITSARKKAMQTVIRRELTQNGSTDFHLLEIGSWAGLSTVIWAQECRKQSKGRVYCIDTWAASSNAPDIMQQAAKKNQIFKLFLHNIHCSGLDDMVFALKASSDAMHAALKPQFFDLIFIDGDHAYTQVKKDLLNYMPLLKENGILCGDDLEYAPQDIDLDFARQHKEDDYIEDHSRNQKYHPGIAVAIEEIFGSVSIQAGFWAMRKSGKDWKQISF